MADNQLLYVNVKICRNGKVKKKSIGQLIVEDKGEG
jgi:hypothetical protein